jgi:hypothetical protein
MYHKPPKKASCPEMICECCAFWHTLFMQHARNPFTGLYAGIKRSKKGGKPRYRFKFIAQSADKDRRGEHCSSGIEMFRIYGEFVTLCCADGQWPPLHPQSKQTDKSEFEKRSAGADRFCEFS